MLNTRKMDYSYNNRLEMLLTTNFEMTDRRRRRRIRTVIFRAAGDFNGQLKNGMNKTRKILVLS